MRRPLLHHACFCTAAFATVTTTSLMDDKLRPQPDDNYFCSRPADGPCVI